MTDDAPKPKKRKWIAIVLGVLLLFGMLGVGCVVVAVSFFRQNMSITEHQRRGGDAAAG